MGYTGIRDREEKLSGIGPGGEKRRWEMDKLTSRTVKFRKLAASQRSMAAGYRRIARHPAYPGQDLICLAKADEMDTMAAKSEAEANLLTDPRRVPGIY